MVFSGSDSQGMSVYGDTQCLKGISEHSSAAADELSHA